MIASPHHDEGEPLHAAVLCGGASRRLGQDKAAVVLDGVPLAVAAGGLARAGGARSVVGVGARPAVAAALGEAGFGVLDDRWPGAGPGAGVVTALLAAPPDALLVVIGCDYPRLRAGTLRALVERVQFDPALAAVVAAAGGRRHPTVGVWRVRRCAGEALLWLQRGGRRLTDLSHHVHAAELEVADDELDDIDTPEQLAAARAHISDGPAGTMR